MNKIKEFLLGTAIVANLFLPHGCNCSGKGNGATGSTTDSTTQTVTKTISFRPSGSPVNNSVYIEMVSGDADKITLCVKVKGGVDVYGAALAVTYPRDKVSFGGYSADGNYLEIAAKDCLCKDSHGTLLIGISKSGEVRGADGDGLLVTLNFTALAAQSNTPIEFNTTNSVLYNSIKPPDGIISGTSWFGGSLSYE